MPRIIVVPEQLRALSAQLQQVADSLHDVANRVGSAYGGLNWEARQKAGVEGQVNEARSRAGALAGQADAMARYVATKAQAFEEADRQGASSFQGSSAYFKQAIEGEEWKLRDFVNGVSREIRGWIKLGELLQPLSAAVIIGASMHAGTTYLGEVIIDLPDWLRTFTGLRAIREAARLSGHLNHFRYTSLPSHMLAVGTALSLPVIAGKWMITDLTGYTGTQRVSAMAVDAVFTLAPVVASYAGAALGTLLFPGGGTAAGYAVGAAAASLIAGTVANIATQWVLGREEVREQAITWVDKNITKPVAQSISAAAQGFYQLLNLEAPSVIPGVRPLAP